MVTEYTSKESAHAHSEMKNVKNVTVMGTKYAPKKVRWCLLFDLQTVEVNAIFRCAYLFTSEIHHQHLNTLNHVSHISRTTKEAKNVRKKRKEK